MVESVVELDHVGMSIESHRLLDDISFAVPSGSFTGLIGPNGAGKTTLLRCIYRYYPLQSGQIRINGEALNRLSRRQLARQLAVVVQETHAVSHLSLWDVISLGLLPERRLLQRPREQERAAIESAAELVGLRKQLSKRFDTLSGGERQRGQLARALVGRPQLLILDEPTNHLDVKYQHEILALLQQLNITTLATIHDLNLASSYCDQLLLLAGGRLVASGTPEAVLTTDHIRAQFGVNCAIDRHPFYHTPYLAFAPQDRELK